MSKSIITISREFGSGGRDIGKKVAETLGYAFYDRTLIDLSIQQDKLSAESMREIEEKLNEALLFKLAVNGSYAEPFWGNIMIPPPDTMFLMQEKIIKNLVEKGPCVIIGTGADFVLRDRTDCLSIFIYSDMNSRVKRAIAEYGVSSDKVESKIHHRDKIRAEHYNKCTFQKWGEAKNYDLCLNSDGLGIEKSIALILKAAE